MLHLPVIVEAAESSPQAAAAAAYQIRKCLAKDSRASVQYNAIMLMRILADNPGPSFTRNMDAKFVSTVKELVKHGRDPSVQQMMRETLDAFEAGKSNDNGLYDLLAMWRHIKGHDARIVPQGAYRPAPPQMAHYPNAQYQQQSPNSLPPPQELVSRVEEARNTAKILLQLLQTTPTTDVMNNELIKEFYERCQAAQRSMQQYINCDSPPPDDDTLQTLIETNEQLSLALTRHQRAVLNARRALGASSASTSPAPGIAAAHPPPLQPPVQAQPQSLFSNTQPYASGPTAAHSPVSPVNDTFSAPPGPPPTHAPSFAASDPFADPVHDHNLDYTPRQHGLGNDSRPAFGLVTDSYMGRQYSAANGLTMHGGVEATTNDGVSPVEPTPAQRDVTYRY